MRNNQVKKLDELGVSGTVVRELIGKGLFKQAKKSLKEEIKTHKRLAFQLGVLYNSIPGDKK